MTDMTITDKISRTELARGLKDGRNILVICKSKFEAHAAAKRLYESSPLSGHHWMLTGNALFVGGRRDKGSVEFGWVETRSGRRLDDFDVSGFSLTDPFHKISLPIVAEGPVVT